MSGNPEDNVKFSIGNCNSKMYLGIDGLVDISRRYKIGKKITGEMVTDFVKRKFVTSPLC
jgi:hypothetical protein